MAPEPGVPGKEVTQANITRVLAIGFTLVILVLTLGGSVALHNILLIRDNVNRVVRAADEMLRASRPMSHEADEMSQEAEEMTAAQSEIDRRVSLFNGQSITLLVGSFGLALVCSIFTVRFTQQLFRNMAWQESELARVSWQMLADQESIAQRFSHELHDELGQTLAALRANLTAAGGAVLMAPEGAVRMQDSIGLTDDAIRSVRQLSQLLRPTILDDFGLDAGLNWLCEGFMQRTGIEVDYRSNHQARLPEKTETQLFRIAQEALTNVARHSGATRAAVSLEAAAGRIRLTISDNGKGMRTAEQPRAKRTPVQAPSGFGMTGMRARARVAGGTFQVRSPEGGGMVIEASIPIPAESSAE